jgi:hypothetical protein
MARKKKQDDTAAEEPAKRTRKALPVDPTPPDSKGTGPTVVATVVLCNMCDHPNMIPQATTAHGIRSKCEKCESTIRLSGGKLAKVRIDSAMIKKLTQLALLPTSTDEGKHTKGDDTGGGEGASRYTFLRVKMLEEQMQIVRLAMEVCRRKCNAEGKDWAGRSIELICADFIAGLDEEGQQILAQVEAELDNDE